MLDRVHVGGASWPIHINVGSIFQILVSVVCSMWARIIVRVPTVREKSGKNGKKFKVREKSGNFELSQVNLIFWEKSGKSQGILESEVEILRGIKEKMTKWLRQFLQSG